ncbi:hypothetical protein [Actinoplanes friuliensis]|uniref:Uncharacterized protein n=1 Tax=Actinoplanes friuliensis DSM 7358 TaxID=1246995 RepID=U5W2X2_9ACTN|nr:hypothetical protein [Actinoplanes friuliensis]AGZ43367.1 hypothetical protein AFR_25515 [Actinoplanes friuliensis DSM 7358]
MHKTAAGRGKAILCTLAVAAVVGGGLWSRADRLFPDADRDEEIYTACVYAVPAGEHRALEGCGAAEERLAPGRTDDPALIQVAGRVVNVVVSSGEGLGGTPTEMVAGRARDGLVRLGYAGSVVRVARDGDPAARGTLVFGVPLTAATCLVGHLDTLSGPASWQMVGLLPGGTCLPA